MTETSAELLERGWRPGASTRGDIETFLADLDNTYAMRCPKCEDPPERGGMRHETWSKTGAWDKCFTVCRTCGFRRPF